MAHYELIHPHHEAPAPGLVARLGNALVDGLRALAASNPKVRQFDAIFALSDAELADRGLRRAGLARAQFVDEFWT